MQQQRANSTQQTDEGFTMIGTTAKKGILLMFLGTAMVLLVATAGCSRAPTAGVDPKAPRLLGGDHAAAAEVMLQLWQIALFAGVVLTIGVKRYRKTLD